jgi:hypothetical protein
MEKRNLNIGINEMSDTLPSIWIEAGDMSVSFSEIDEFKKLAAELANDLGMTVDLASGCFGVEDGGSDILLVLDFAFDLEEDEENFDVDAFKEKVIALTKAEGLEDGQWQDYSF